MDPFELADAMASRALKGHEFSLGENHPNTLKDVLILARVKCAQEDVPATRALIDRALGNFV